MLGPQELLVVLWIFGWFVIAVLVVYAVRRHFQKREKKSEKDRDSNSRR